MSASRKLRRSVERVLERQLWAVSNRELTLSPELILQRGER